MSNVQSQDTDCQEGVCEVTFKPVRAAKRSFQNLKSMASDLIEKVKETMIGSADPAADQNIIEEGAKNHLAKMRVDTVKDQVVGEQSSDSHVSIRNAQILDRYVQSGWQAIPGANGPVGVRQPLSVVQMRMHPAPGQIKASRYDNPWRYDNRH